ncbi:hypothetical protein T08_12032 [Trichinella sp. T8]|nr:hypothetical protein T08_12032 [Trichinella sp. T8]
MKSRIIVLDKARLDSKKVLKGVCFLQFFKLEWLIYNVLCCVREVTFPKVSIQHVNDEVGKVDRVEISFLIVLERLPKTENGIQFDQVMMMFLKFEQIMKKK